MHFRVTSALPRAAADRPAPVAPASPVAVGREACCRSCAELAGGIRCVALCGVCPADHRRITPWANLPRCPARKW